MVNISNLGQLLEQYNTPHANRTTQLELLQKMQEVLLKQLEVGDLIEGIIKEGSNGKCKLVTPEGLSFNVQLEGGVETQVKLSFLVTGKENGKLVLQVADPKGQLEIPIRDQVIETFQLPKDQRMNECIDAFLSKQMPLQKEELMQTYYLQKQLNLPSSVLAEVLSHTGFLNQEGLWSVSELKQEGFSKLVNQIEQCLTTQCTKEEAITVLKNYIVSLAEHLESPTLQEGLNFKMLPQALKESFGLEEVQNMPLRQGLEQLFSKEMAPKDLKTFVQWICKETLCVTPKELKEDSANVFKVFQTAERVGKLTTLIAQNENPAIDQEMIQNLLRQTEDLQEINKQGQYFLFPFQDFKEKVRGELYYYKPKKNTKKQKDEHYLVLALTLPALKELEIHIKQTGKALVFAFKVEEEAIRDYFVASMSKLKDSLEARGFKIEACHYDLKEQVQEGLTHQIQTISEKLQSVSLKHFDFKA